MKNALAALSIGLLVLVSGCFTARSVSVVKIAGQTVTVQEAVTPVEQAQGLARVANLAWDQGMLFRFGERQTRTFWMKNMIIPIDIIWIAGKRVVGIEQNVPPPKGRVSDDELARYASPVPVDLVLEVRSGFAKKYNVQIGDLIEYE